MLCFVYCVWLNVLLLRVMCVTCLLCTCCTTATGLKPICSKIINIYIYIYKTIILILNHKNDGCRFNQPLTSTLFTYLLIAILWVNVSSDEEFNTLLTGSSKRHRDWFFGMEVKQAIWRLSVTVIVSSWCFYPGKELLFCIGGERNAFVCRAINWRVAMRLGLTKYSTTRLLWKSKCCVTMKKVTSVTYGISKVQLLNKSLPFQTLCF
jgi:hypothetical protein